MSNKQHVPKPCSSCKNQPHEPGSILCTSCQARLVKANRLLQQWQEEHKQLGYEISFVEQQPMSEEVWVLNGYPSDETVARWDKVNAEQGGSLDLEDVLVHHSHGKVSTER